MKRWERKRRNSETKGPLPLNVILEDWFQSSSIDGIGHAGRARNRCTRILWIIVLLVGLGVTSYHIYYILHEYYHHPIQTTMALSSEKKVTFPSVTVCNENRIHCGNLNALLTQLYCQEGHFPADWINEDCNHYHNNIATNNKVGKDVIDILIEVHALTHCELPMGYFWADEQIVDQMLDALGRVMDSSYNTEAKFLALMAKLPQSIRIQIGHQLVDFVKECTYKGELCQRTSWLTFNTPSHGNCFAFNHVSNPNDPRAGKRKSAFPGQFTGLKLILNLELVEYIKNELTESSGALALIQASKIAFH